MKREVSNLFIGVIVLETEKSFEKFYFFENSEKF